MWLKGLILFSVVVFFFSCTVVAIRWHAMRQIEIEKLPQVGQEWCEIAPSFEMREGSEMILTASFWAEAYSFYSISTDMSINNGTYVMEGSEVSTSINLDQGWNTVYLMYGRADPKCWSVISVRVWAPYLLYPWEWENAVDDDPQPLPVPHWDTLEASIPVKYEI